MGVAELLGHNSLLHNLDHFRSLLWGYQIEN
jgi:hypothetical protein